MMDYVTYDETGRLTGAYCQELHPDHADNFLEVTPEQRENWVLYKANAARDGLEDADPLPPPEPAMVPSVPMLNLKFTLSQDGKLAQAEQIISTMEGEDGALARAYWTNAQNAWHDNALVAALWPQLYADEAEFKGAWSRAAAANP